MNKLINDYNRGFSLKNDDLRFVDAAVRQALSDAIKAHNIDGSVIIWGCDITISGTTATVTEGAIFHANEIWHVDEHTFTVPDPLDDYPFWCFITEWDAAGAKTDKDLGAHNTYQIRKAVGNMANDIAGTISYISFEDRIPKLNESDLTTMSIPLPFGVTSDHATYLPVAVKQSGLVHIEMGIFATLSGSTHVGTIPAGYRPVRPLNGIARGNSSTSGNVLIYWLINPDDGKIYVELFTSSEDTGPFQIYLHSPSYRIN